MGENGRQSQQLQEPSKILTEVLGQGLVPVSLKLKNHVRTQRGRSIIQKAEKQLLNERMKSINYTLECYDHDRYMYKNELKELLEHDQEIWKT